MPLLDPDWLSKASAQRWLVAVSGGRDSVALLHACVNAGLENLVVCHINHQLRGSESDGDEAFVRNLAEQLQLPSFIYKADVRSIAEQEQKSIELAAREARHSAFSQACNELQCAGVLLAHHADDQAETILYNLLRGSAGLKGMQAISEIESLGFNLHRPLLNVRRSEIDEFITNHQIKYREDSTNAEPFAVRNRMRNEALPLLTEILDRDVTDSILRSHHISEQQNDFIEQQLDYGKMLDPQGRIHIPSLASQPIFIQQKIIHRYLTEHKISNINQSLITSCINLLDTHNPAKINLSKGRYLRRKEQRLFVED